MKKTIKILLLQFFILFLISMLYSVNAASATISASKSNATVGEVVTINVNIYAAAWNVSVSGSGISDSITGYNDDAVNTSKSKSYTLNTSKAGTYTVSISGDITDETSDYSSPVSKSVTVTVSNPPPASSGSSSSGNSGSSGGSSSSSGSSTGTSTNKKPTTNTTKPKEEVKKSTDNTLSVLSIAEGTISPAFEKDVREYALTIPYETTEVNVTATPSDSKATVAVEGNKDLKEGENIVTVKVTAEDGTVASYIIKVTRARVPLALNSLLVKYENQEGQIIEVSLNPTFNFATLEYTLQDLEYWVEKLSIEAIANIEGATIDIQGADALQTGENTITITVKILEQNIPEGEEPKEETIAYTIKVNKLEEPTLMAKISNWFRGIMGTVGTWFNNNQPKIILGALALCIVALIGLSIYIVVDYNKYKDVVAKLKKVTEINANTEIVEEIEQSSNITEQEIVEDNDKDDKPKRGKHF